MPDRRIWRSGRFCNANCKSGYKEDLRHGLNYGPHRLVDEHGVVTGVSRRAFCADQMVCVYCGADLEHTTGTVR